MCTAHDPEIGNDPEDAFLDGGGEGVIGDHAGALAEDLVFPLTAVGLGDSGGDFPDPPAKLLAYFGREGPQGALEHSPLRDDIGGIAGGQLADGQHRFLPMNSMLTTTDWWDVVPASSITLAILYASASRRPILSRNFLITNLSRQVSKKGSMTG